MAYLTKEQYEHRREAAAERTIKSMDAGISNGMTEEQAALIGDLCTLRHELHCNLGDCVMGGESETAASIRRKLEALIDEINSSGLPKMPVTSQDVTDMWDVWLCIDVGEDDQGNVVPAHEDFEDEPFHTWYENAYDRLFDKWDDFHHQIEQYLGTIDLQYGTNFEPTGVLRGF